MLRRVLLWIAVVLVVAGGIAYGIAARRTAHQQKRAEELLRALTTIRVGSSTFDDAKRIAEAFGDLRWQTTPCSRKLCHHQFAIRATTFWRLRLARPARFGADLRVEDGIVISKSVSLEVGRFPYTPTYRAGEAMETTFIQTDGGFQVTARRDETGAFTSVDVRLTPSATEDQRRRAFAFNLGCLSKIGSCRDVRQILPLITPEKGDVN